MDYLPRQLLLCAGYVFCLSASLYAACPAPGTGIIANGTVETETGCTVTTTDPATAGLLATNSGIINLTSSTVATSGDASPGAQANTGGVINFTGGTSLATSGIGSIGADCADTDSQINLDSVSVTTNGPNSICLQASSGGTISMTGAPLVLNGTADGVVEAVSGSGSAISITNCPVTISGDVNHCCVAFGANSIALDNCTITVPGSTGDILNAAGGGAIIDFLNSSATTTTLGVTGAVCSPTSTITIDNSSLTLNNLNISAGIADSGTVNIQNGSSVAVSGTSCFGIDLSGSTTTVSESTITASGTNAIAIRFNNAGSSLVLLESSVTSNNSNAVQIIGAGSQTMNATSTEFIAPNATIFQVSGSGTHTFDFNQVQAFATSSPLYSGGANTVTLNATASSFSGTIQRLTGILNIIFTDTTWTGISSGITNVTLNNSLWNVPLTSQINSSLTLNGSSTNVEFVFPTIADLIVFGAYQGTANPTLTLNTFLGDDSSPSCKLVLINAAATGTTRLFIRNTGGPGAQTTGNGILVVDASNASTTTPTAFTLANKVVAGPFQYRLFRGDLTANDPNSWYLRSSALQPQPFRSEVSLYAALPSMALLYGRMLIDTLHQRVGELEQLRCNCNLCGDRAFNGFWARGLKAGGSQTNGTLLHEGPNFDYNLSAAQLGVDVYRSQYFNGHRDHIGVLWALGTGSGAVEHFSRNAGKNEFEVYSIGGYWTHFGCSGWYLDGVIEGSWYRNMLANAHRIAPLTTQGRSVALSVEGGYPFRFCSFLLEPQAQFVYQRLSLDDGSDQGATIHFRRTHSAAARAGLRAANTWNFGCNCPRYITLWLRASIWHDFEGNSRTFFSSADGAVGFRSNLQGSWTQADLGVTTQLTQHLYLYGSVGGNIYFHNRGTAYNAIAGIRVNY